MTPAQLGLLICLLMAVAFAIGGVLIQVFDYDGEGDSWADKYIRIVDKNAEGMLLFGILCVIGGLFL